MPPANSPPTTHSLPVVTTSAPCQYHRGNGLTIWDLCVLYDQLLFQAPQNLHLPHGSITGLVGTNGCGKTSLAKLLAAKAIDGFPSWLTVEYLAAADDEDRPALLAQDNDEDISTSLQQSPKEYIQTRIQARLDVLQTEIDDLEASLEQDQDNTTDQEKVEEIADRLSDLYDLQESIQNKLERETQQSMERVGLYPHHIHKTLAQLSCGWRYKCRLVATLLAHPDLLIIDEPSFLDTESTEWLVEHLQRLAQNEKVMVLLISHKEALLEVLCHRIWYINSATQHLSTYACRYSAFRATLESEIQHASKTMEDSQDKLETAEKSLKQIQKVMQKRETNFNKTERSFDKAYLRGKCKEAKQNADHSAASKLKKAQHTLEQAKEAKRLAQREKIKPLRIDGIPADSGTLVSLQEVGLYYDEDGGNPTEGSPHEPEPAWVFRCVDTTLEVNDRVLLRGPNGCGKSSLVQLILGNLDPSEGSVTRSTRNILYFPQTALHDLLRDHGHETGLEFLWAGDWNCNCNSMTETQARQHLANFGLAKELALQSVWTLSAGQRVRLWLAKQVLEHPKPSLLILDEMSENVDVETRKSLVDMLQHFAGAVLVVSHDPDFCASFAFTKTWTLYPVGIHVQYPE